MTDLQPPGWYPDPEQPAHRRYWDGTRWTDHRAAPAGAGPAPAWPSVPPPPPGGGFRSMKGLATALTVLLIAVACLSLLEAFAHFDRAGIIDDFLGDGDVTIGEIGDADDAVFGTTVLSLLGFLAAGIVFIVWLHRGYRNAEAFRHHDLRLSAGWAIGAWFIPFYNYIGPKLIVNDLWRATDPEVRAGDREWRSRRIAGVVHWWWALFVIQSLLGLGTFNNEGDSVEDLERFRDLDRVAGVGAVVAVAAAILGIIVVRRLTARFAGRAQAFGLAAP